MTDQPTTAARLVCAGCGKRSDKPGVCWDCLDSVIDGPDTLRDALGAHDIPDVLHDRILVAVEEWVTTYGAENPYAYELAETIRCSR